MVLTYAFKYRVPSGSGFYIIGLVALHIGSTADPIIKTGRVKCLWLYDTTHKHWRKRYSHPNGTFPESMVTQKSTRSAAALELPPPEGSETRGRKNVHRILRFWSKCSETSGFFSRDSPDRHLMVFITLLLKLSQ